MGDSGGIRAGKAFVEFFTKDRGFTRELDKYARKLKDLGQNITDIGKKALIGGAAITAPFIVAAQQFASMGSEINDMAARTGLGVVAVQELKFAAEQTGASFEDVETATKKMQKTLFDAAGGSASAREALAGLNLTVDDLKNLKPEDQIALIGERMKGVTDPAARTAIAMEIFGKAGTKVIPMLAELGALKQRLHDLGAVFSPEDVALADKFGDEMDQVWLQIRAVVFQVGAAVAKALLPFANVVHTILRKVIDWARANSGLLVTILTAGAALLAAGGAVFSLGIAIKAAGFALSGITAGFSFVTSALGLLLNPITLVIAALVGLAGYFIYTSGQGSAMVDWLGAKFSILKDTALTTFGGIADALSAGDIGLAAQILWTGLQTAWIQGTQELQAKWSQFKAFMVKVAIGAFYGVLSAWAIVSASLQGAFASTTSFFVDAWNTAVEEVTKLFDFMERGERAREKARIQRQLARTDLAPNVRAQLERQLANVDRHADGVLAKRQQSDDEARVQRAKDLEDKLAKIKEERDKKLTENVDAEQAVGAGADANAKDDIAALDARKRELEAQLAALRKKAGEEKKAGGGGGLGDSKKKQDLIDVAQNANVRQSAGIFNAAAAQSLKGNPVQDQIAANTKATADGVRRLANNQTVFA